MDNPCSPTRMTANEATATPTGTTDSHTADPTINTPATTIDVSR